MNNKLLSLWYFILSFRGRFLDGVVLYYIINIGSYLILPKLYSFEIFGEYIYYTSYTMILSYVLTSKIEIFISNEKKELIKIRLYNTYLSVVVSFLFMILLLLILLNKFTFFIENYILISIFFITIFQIYIIVYNQNWLSIADYKKIIYMRFYPYAILLLFQLGAYIYFGNSLKVIITSSAISSFIVTLILSLITFKVGFDFKKFYNFILKTRSKICITLPSTSINVITQNITTLLIRNFIDSNTLGVYALITKIVGAPCSILGQFIIEKYKKDINIISNAKESLLPIFKYLLINLFSISAIVYSFYALLSLFEFQYYLTNEKMNFSIFIVIALFFTRMIVSPLTYFIYFLEKIDFDLKLQSIHLVLILILIIFIGKLNIIDTLNILNIIIYFVYISILYYKLSYVKGK